MKVQKFDEIIKVRANQRVQIKINNFRSTINLALQTLLGYNQRSVQYPSVKEKAVIAAVLSIVNPNDKPEDWPSMIWENEEKAVQAELLNIMDEMQKALQSVEMMKEKGGIDENYRTAE